MTKQELLENINKDLAEMAVSERAHVQRSRIMQAYMNKVKQEEQESEESVEVVENE